MNPFDELKQVFAELQKLKTEDPSIKRVLGLVADSIVQCISLIESDQRVITQQAHMINALLVALQVSSGIKPQTEQPVDNTPLITLPVVPDAPTPRLGRHPNITRHVGVGANDAPDGKHPHN